MTRQAELDALHLEAAHLIRDGLCADHVDAKIAALEAELSTTERAELLHDRETAR